LIHIKESYKTIEKLGEAVFVDRKSKFIAHTKPVTSEQEALDFLQEMRSKYSDANHNVYAYIIDENNIFRYSDDGEPNGTSGMPVLDSMRNQGIVDAITVVTRYFGGTLLGTGGLVHAYTTSACEAINAAGIITRVLCDSMLVKTDYNLSGKVQYLISSKNYLLEHTEYADNVEFTVSLKKDETGLFVKELADVTAGKAVTKILCEKYVDIK